MIAIVNHNQSQMNEAYFGHSLYKYCWKILPIRYCINIAINILYLRALSDTMKSYEAIHILVPFLSHF